MIIDAHSHIGNEKFNIRDEITLDAYKNFASKVGIDIALIMPVPCPLAPEDINLSFQNERVILTWQYENGFFKDISNCDEIVKRNLVNPYKEINEYYYNILKNWDNFFFIPIIHPRLDTDEGLIETIEKYDPVALKIHSVGTLCEPNDIRESYTEIIKKYNIPIIVHTDFNNGKFDYNKGLYEAVKKANALNWFLYFENNQIHGTLNHGATLNLEVFKKVNDSKYVKVALEPSIFFGGDYRRLNVDEQLYKEKGFLKIIYDYLLSTKIIFDVDYDYNQTFQKEIDIEVVNRIKELWNEEEQEFIFCKNALEQYPKLEKKIRR